MEKDLQVQNEMAMADDFLIQVAEQAERRIDAVIKIRKVALKVTNPRDWTDQNGNPYLQASGSEKVANLFNIFWRIDEPTYEEDPDWEEEFVESIMLICEHYRRCILTEYDCIHKMPHEFSPTCDFIMGCKDSGECPANCMEIVFNERRETWPLKTP